MARVRVVARMPGLFADMYGALLSGKIAVEAEHEHIMPAESLDAVLADLLRS